MQLFRITRAKYAEDLSGEGARKYGGRWNRKGLNVVYTSQYRSLAVLEILAHTPISTIPDDLQMLEIFVPDDSSIKELNIETLPNNWRTYPAPYSLGELGSKWIAEKNSLLLKVPSVIIPSESNFLLNPHHPKFAEVKIKSIEAFSFDSRLQS